MADPEENDGTSWYSVDISAEVDRFFDESSLAQGKPCLVLILGGVSVGKTTLRKMRFSQGYVLLDAAEIFLNLSRGEYYDFPEAFQEPMELIGELVATRAVRERRNIVTEMLVDAIEPVVAVMDAMKSLGYVVNGQRVTCDVEEALRRNDNRSDDDISAYYTQEFHQRWLLNAAGKSTETG